MIYPLPTQQMPTTTALENSADTPKSTPRTVRRSEKLRLPTNKHILWLTPLIAGALAFTTLHVHSQAPEQELQPKVARTQDDGGVFYQRISLKNDNIQFFERGKSLNSYGRYVDYTVGQDDAGHLTGFHLTLSADANTQQRYQSTPGGQSLLPLFNSTSYQDLDGDSVLDTMIKNGPQGSGCYILYQNKWTEVRRYMTGLAADRPALSPDGKTKYVFLKGHWETTPLQSP